MTFRTPNFGFAWALAVLLAWSCSTGTADTFTPDQIRAAMQSERSKIISGRLVANGRYKITGDPELNGEGVISWKHEFDYADDYFLFERNEPRDPNIPVSLLPSVDTTRLRTLFAEDKLATYAYHDQFKHDSALRVYDRSDSESRPDQSFFRRFNVRGLGFYNGPDLLSVSERGDRIVFEHPNVTKRGAKIKVSQDSENILKLYCKDPDDPEGPDADNSCLWVDKSRGFIPIRRAAITNGELELDSRTEWKLIDEVWVPTRLTGNFRVPFLPRGAGEDDELEHRISEFELDIVWESLNENVGTGKIHDLRNFDLSEGTRAFKGKELVHIYGIELPVRDLSEKPKKVASQNKSRLPVYLGSLLLLVISITLWRRRRVKNG
jgi:hypothetical protein